MWKQISLNGQDYLFQHKLEEESGVYHILLTDLKLLFTQKLTVEEFSHEFQKLNSDLEVSSFEDIVLNMFQILDHWVVGQKKSAASLSHKIQGKEPAI
jgi:regulatory protein YycH of two-component signal transduction system YycFG